MISVRRQTWTTKARSACGSRWTQCAAGAALALASSRASANCARPSGYEVEVVGSTVTICPINMQGRECPDPDGMLRQSATETARLPDRCSVARDGTSCYVDECVPSGEYKYGFATPYECCAYCCGTYYYEGVRVGGGPAGDCTPDGGAPVAVSGDAPWSASDLICNYAGGSGAAGGSGGQSGGGGQPDAGDGGSPESSSAGCGCVVGAGSSAPQLVFTANALLVLVGLALHRRGRPPRA